MEAPVVSCAQRVSQFIQSHGLAAPDLFNFCHVNGHDISAVAPNRILNRSSALVAFCGAIGVVHFGNVLVFVRDRPTGRQFAVVSRRIATVSRDPFYVCLPPVNIDSPLVLVPVENIHCGCSAWPLPNVNPSMDMVIFHQLSDYLHQFE